MIQSTYLTHLRTTNREPPEAAALLKQAAWAKVCWPWMTEAERQAAKNEVYRLTAQWWRMVRQ